MTGSRSWFIAGTLCAFMTAGCSETGGPHALTAPSPLNSSLLTDSGPFATMSTADAGNETPTAPTVPNTPGAGKKARGEGVVGAITGSCPELVLIITGTRVSTTATTEYVNGSCETLRPGTKVTIDGELFPGGSATAEKITIQRIPGGQRVSGDGRVDVVDGSCPALTLTVRGITVVTSAETTFSGGTCEDIRERSHLDVTGDYDGTQVTATAVQIRRR
jgi:hypothetical protein